MLRISFGHITMTYYHTRVWWKGLPWKGVSREAAGFYRPGHEEVQPYSAIARFERAHPAVVFLIELRFCSYVHNGNGLCFGVEMVPRETDSNISHSPIQ